MFYCIYTIKYYIISYGIPFSFQHMKKFMPKTATTQQLQKQYRSLFNEIVERHEPLVIMNRNKPEVVILDIQTFETMKENNEKYEEAEALKAVAGYQKEKREGKLKKLTSLADLIDED